MRHPMMALALLGGVVCTTDAALAQDCVQDQYGRIVCGQRIAPYEPERRPYRDPRYYEPEPQQPYYQPRPQPYYQPQPYVGGRYGDREPRYAPPNPQYRTWNNCPPQYTVQDGLCKPYTGR